MKRNKEYRQGNGFLLGITRAVKNLAYNISDMLAYNDGMYDDEPKFSRSVMESRQYYAGAYNPPVSKYATKREMRQQYEFYQKDHPVYKEKKENNANDIIDKDYEEIDNNKKSSKSRASIRKKELIRKVKASAGKVGSGALNVAKDSAKMAVEATKETAKDLLKSNETKQEEVTVKSFEGQDVEVENEVVEQPSETTATKIKGFGASVIKSFKDGMDDLDFDLDLENNSEDYKEIDLLNLKDSLEEDIGYKAIVTSSLLLNLSDGVAREKALSNDQIKQDLKKVNTDNPNKIITEDKLYVVPGANGTMLVLKDKIREDKKEDIMKIRFKICYQGNLDEVERNYNTSELFIRGSKTRPITIYFKISEP